MSAAVDTSTLAVRQRLYECPRHRLGSRWTHDAGLTLVYPGSSWSWVGVITLNYDLIAPQPCCFSSGTSTEGGNIFQVHSRWFGGWESFSKLLRIVQLEVFQNSYRFKRKGLGTNFFLDCIIFSVWFLSTRI